ncbi:Alpha-glucosidase [Fulvia fulva]|nr:Alpha-glucosidase [Fulvia fulva]
MQQFWTFDFHQTSWEYENISVMRDVAQGYKDANSPLDTVMRTLAWEFPEDETLKGTYAQFMLGPSIVVTPVLVPNVDTVSNVFPGIGEGTRWYDRYTLQEVVDATPQGNVTMAAPLEHIDVHVG